MELSGRKLAKDKQQWFSMVTALCAHMHEEDEGSKRIQFKLTHCQQHLEIYEFYATDNFIPNNSTGTHTPHKLVIAVDANSVTFKPPSDLTLLLH